MISRPDSTLKLFGASIILIMVCLATLPYMSSRQENETMESLKWVAAKERAYSAV